MAVDEWLSGAVPAGTSTSEPDRETWGLLPEHQAALQRAMVVVGVGATGDGTATGDTAVVEEAGP